MKHTDTPGIFLHKDKLFTETLASAKGIKVYNERFMTWKGKEYRSWNPYRSKLAAALLKGLFLPVDSTSHVLYLGAATGTTVSHFSDILRKGIVYAVENSAFAFHGLLTLAQQRSNIIPILEDAYHPDRYSTFVSKVDLLYQDLSQRNQAEIFIENSRSYLTPNGLGIFMVKARSIDVSLQPKEAYTQVYSTLKTQGFHPETPYDLAPYHKDHAVIVVKP
jgi:fibrillarin-like pre-rRNA processing protein